MTPVPDSTTISTEQAVVDGKAPAEPRLEQALSPATSAQLPVPATVKRVTAVNLGSPELQPGATLEIEAFEMLEQRRFSEALTLAGALGRLRPDDVIPDAIAAVAGANTTTKRAGSAAAKRLRDRLLEPAALQAADAETRRRHAIGWGAMSSYFLAFHDYSSADHAARQLLAIDPDSSTAWWQLAASYAGLGWFDEAEQCMASARSSVADASAPLARWQVGRSINRWAMTKTPAVWLSVLMWFFVGLLGFAVYLSTPFLARELRVPRLGEELRTLAAEHWATDTRRRLLTAAGVLLVIGLWILGLVFLAPSSG